MQPSVFLAQSTDFDMLDSVFAASVAIGFAFALLLVLCSSRMPRAWPGRRPIRLARPMARTASRGRPALWQSVPGAIPVGIGTFLIGFGVAGLSLRGSAVSDLGRFLIAGAGGTLFGVLFLALLASYFGGGAREEVGSALIGAVARVSLDIPSDGAGRIAFERGGRRGTMPARSRDGRALPQGASAFVVGVEGGIALVEEF